ncbi:hypothetical protein ACOME3_004032 [Neoechinorhynchus agilis]
MPQRQKGKTVEVGRAYFETSRRHYIVLDAPGHKCFVPNMIGGASQADIAILVISARKGEFETGFERGGQTREHAMLVKTAGVKHLIVLVNKMDDPTVDWDEMRFEEIKQRLTPFLKKCGFQSKDGGLCYIPCSGMTGSNLKEVSNALGWYKGPSLIEYMDSLPPFPRSLDSPFRMPIVDRYKDMGTVVIGKIESGCVRLNDRLILMPNKTKVEVCQITIESVDTDAAMCGENVKLKLKGIEEEEISSGFILCDCEDVCHVGKVFDAQIAVLDYKSIICPGYSAVMHLHAGVYEVQLKAIIKTLGKKPTDRGQIRPRFIKQDSNAIVRLEVTDVACMETFQKYPQMGRFTLRDEAKTVAIGKILKIVE